MTHRYLGTPLHLDAHLSDARPLLLLGTSASAVGCKPKITLGDLRKKNRPTIDAAQTAFVEMNRVIGAAPAPAVNGPCARPGLVPVVPIMFGTVSAKDRFGPTGNPDTELMTRPIS